MRCVVLTVGRQLVGAILAVSDSVADLFGADAVAHLRTLELAARTLRTVGRPLVAVVAAVVVRVTQPRATHAYLQSTTTHTHTHTHIHTRLTALFPGLPR